MARSLRRRRTPPRTIPAAPGRPPEVLHIDAAVDLRRELRVAVAQQPLASTRPVPARASRDAQVCLRLCRSTLRPSPSRRGIPAASSTRLGTRLMLLLDWHHACSSGDRNASSVGSRSRPRSSACTPLSRSSSATRSSCRGKVRRRPVLAASARITSVRWNVHVRPGDLAQLAVARAGCQQRAEEWRLGNARPAREAIKPIRAPQRSSAVTRAKMVVRRTISGALCDKVGPALH